MRQATNSRPTPKDMTEARALLARLGGSTHRDRTAFAFGYIVAFDQDCYRYWAGQFKTYA